MSFSHFTSSSSLLLFAVVVFSSLFCHNMSHVSCLSCLSHRISSFHHVITSLFLVMHSPHLTSPQLNFPQSQNPLPLPSPLSRLHSKVIRSSLLLLLFPSGLRFTSLFAAYPQPEKSLFPLLRNQSLNRNPLSFLFHFLSFNPLTLWFVFTRMTLACTFGMARGLL